MVGATGVKVSAATALVGLVVCASAGCAQIVGVDWSEYEQEDTGLSCAGLPAACGPTGKESCCASAMVRGGTFTRSDDPEFTATVSDFRLDRFEVTVGRFRKFVEAYPGSKPAAGAGAHPRIAGSGWDPRFDSELPVDAAKLKEDVNCRPSEGFPTWTDEVSNHENLPMNCVTWYQAFAFCAWDGGRLPTEMESMYAAAGGAEQRVYPWSNPADSALIDGSFASYWCGGDEAVAPQCAFNDILPVGSRSPKGDGKWDQADLAGSMCEWVLDVDAEEPPEECNDCGSVSGSSDDAPRVHRGGCWRDREERLKNSSRVAFDPLDPYDTFGIRCARD
ncbi:formylglycine-generating enzyme family protein [Sorangium sp. So ce385]|uniref:formylglycine-generating enzyme family protein n=1 Tax=Sorangium sp. So ce385 TaxID=3133308 RepID=UPI003F5B72E8